MQAFQSALEAIINGGEVPSSSYLENLVNQISSSSVISYPAFSTDLTAYIDGKYSLISGLIDSKSANEVQLQVFALGIYAEIEGNVDRIIQSIATELKNYINGGNLYPLCIVQLEALANISAYSTLDLTVLPAKFYQDIVNVHYNNPCLILDVINNATPENAQALLNEMEGK